MHTTPVSLLERLHRPDNQVAWERFVKLYTPLLYYWSLRLGLQESDAADLVQDVFEVLLRKLPQFEYDRAKSFRSWLRQMLVNKWRDRRRRAAIATESGGEAPEEVPAADSVAAFIESEYQQHLVARALELMQAEFEPVTWRACREFVVSDRPASEVAAELGITVNAVYLAKSRVLRRLRIELQGLLD